MYIHTMDIELLLHIVLSTYILYLLLQIKHCVIIYILIINQTIYLFLFEELLLRTFAMLILQTFV